METLSRKMAFPFGESCKVKESEEGPDRGAWERLREAMGSKPGKEKG